MTPLKKASSHLGASHDVDRHLHDLQLAFLAEHYGELATQAASKHCAHVEYLGELVAGEAHVRRDRATHNRIRMARFPVMKTLDQFRWDWPTQMNQEHSTILTAQRESFYNREKCDRFPM